MTAIWGIFVVIAASLAFGVSLREQRRRKQPYWVEYISPGQLRDGDDDFAVVYHEGDKWHFFYGKVKRRPSADVLQVPGQDTWRAQVPGWMADKRGAVVERIRQEVRWVQVVEKERA